MRGGGVCKEEMEGERGGAQRERGEREETEGRGRERRK
jgi:hypothetical protein